MGVEDSRTEIDPKLQRSVPPPITRPLVNRKTRKRGTPSVQTVNGGVRNVGVARDNPVAPTENGGGRKRVGAARDNPENYGVSTTDPFAELFRTKDAIETIPPEWQSGAGTSKGKS